MSICECGQVSVPLGKVSVQVFGTIHGVTACGPCDRHWKDRAEKAEAAIARVRGVPKKVAVARKCDVENPQKLAWYQGWNDAIDAVSRALDGDA